MADRTTTIKLAIILDEARAKSASSAIRTYFAGMTREQAAAIKEQARAETVAVNEQVKQDSVRKKSASDVAATRKKNAADVATAQAKSDAAIAASSAKAAATVAVANDKIAASAIRLGNVQESQANRVAAAVKRTTAQEKSDRQTLAEYQYRTGQQSYEQFVSFLKREEEAEKSSFARRNALRQTQIRVLQERQSVVGQRQEKVRSNIPGVAPINVKRFGLVVEAGQQVAQTMQSVAPYVAFADEISKKAAELIDLQYRVEQVFGQSSKTITDWSKNAAKTAGLSRKDALEAAGTIGNVLRGAGIGEGQRGKMAQELTQRAADIAAFNRTAGGVPQVMTAMVSAIEGKGQRLKGFGAYLTEATIRTEALNDGLLKPVKNSQQIQIAFERVAEAAAHYRDQVAKFGPDTEEAAKASTAVEVANARLEKAWGGSIPKLDAQQKLMAAYRIIMRETGNQADTFTKRIGLATNAQSQLNAEVENAQVDLGEKLLPLRSQVISMLTDWVVWWNKLNDATGGAATTIAAWTLVIGPAAAVVGQIVLQLIQLRAQFALLKEGAQIQGAIDALKTGLTGTGEAAAVTAEEINTVGGAAATAASEATALQTALAGLTAMGPIAIPITIALAIAGAVKGYTDYQNRHNQAIQDYDATPNTVATTNAKINDARAVIGYLQTHDVMQQPLPGSAYKPAVKLTADQETLFEEMRNQQERQGGDMNTAPKIAQAGAAIVQTLQGNIKGYEANLKNQNRIENRAMLAHDLGLSSLRIGPDAGVGGLSLLDRERLKSVDSALADFKAGGTITSTGRNKKGEVVDINVGGNVKQVVEALRSRGIEASVSNGQAEIEFATPDVTITGNGGGKPLVNGAARLVAQNKAVRAVEAERKRQERDRKAAAKREAQINAAIARISDQGDVKSARSDFSIALSAMKGVGKSALPDDDDDTPKESEKVTAFRADAKEQAERTRKMMEAASLALLKAQKQANAAVVAQFYPALPKGATVAAQKDHEAKVSAALTKLDKKPYEDYYERMGVINRALEIEGKNVEKSVDKMQKADAKEIAAKEKATKEAEEARVKRVEALDKYLASEGHLIDAQIADARQRKDYTREESLIRSKRANEVDQAQAELVKAIGDRMGPDLALSAMGMPGTVSVEDQAALAEFSAKVREAYAKMSDSILSVYSQQEKKVNELAESIMSTAASETTNYMQSIFDILGHQVLGKRNRYEKGDSARKSFQRAGEDLVRGTASGIERDAFGRVQKSLDQGARDFFRPKRDENGKPVGPSEANHLLDQVKNSQVGKSIEQSAQKAAQYLRLGGKDAGKDLAEGAGTIFTAAGALEGAFGKGHKRRFGGLLGMIAGGVAGSFLGPVGWKAGAMAGGQLGGMLGFAGGGVPPLGKLVMVGEHGPELARFDTPARIYSHSDTRTMLAGAGGEIHTHYHTHTGPGMQVGTIHDRADADHMMDVWKDNIDGFNRR